MIDAEAFFGAWARLCKRFGRVVDNSEAADYLAYLEAAGMSTDEVLAAASAVWATREFFPRPADFLAHQAARGWTAILNGVHKVHQHQSAESAAMLRATIPDRAFRAMVSLGGWPSIKESRDMLRLRTAFFDAFEMVVIEEAAGDQIPPGTVKPALVAPEPEASRPRLVDADVRVEGVGAKGPQRVGVALGAPREEP